MPQRVRRYNKGRRAYATPRTNADSTTQLTDCDPKTLCIALPLTDVQAQKKESIREPKGLTNVLYHHRTPALGQTYALPCE